MRCLSFEQILQIFASAVLERRIIFLAEGLRLVQSLSSSPELTGIPGFQGTDRTVLQGTQAVGPVCSPFLHTVLICTKA